MVDTLAGRFDLCGPAPYSMNHKTEVCTMHMQDIQKRFTEKVAEYLTAGYIFSQETMHGSQGEMCKGV